MDERIKASFTSASDSCKQLITLATGLLGLEITFANYLVKNINTLDKILIDLSWFLLSLSVVAGIWALFAITGSLGSIKDETPLSIYNLNIKFPFVLQISLFLMGLALTVVFGIYGIL